MENKSRRVPIILRVTTTFYIGQRGLPATSLESAEEKPSRLSVLKEIKTKINGWFKQTQYMANAYGKAFKISPITASRIVACISPEACSRVWWTSACRSVSVFWKRFSILVRRFSQDSYSFGNRVPRFMVRISVFRDTSSRFSERHNTTSSSLQYNTLNAELTRRMITIRDAQKETNLGSGLMVVRKPFYRRPRRSEMSSHEPLHRFSVKQFRR